MSPLLSRVTLCGGELLDPELGRFEARDACAEQLFAAPEERDRVVHRDVSPLEPRDDVLELFLELLEGPVTHGRTSSTRAPSPPDASSMSSRSPGVTLAESRSASPPDRTIAYPRARVESGDSACSRAPEWSSVARRRSRRSRGERRSRSPTRSSRCASR